MARGSASKVARIRRCKKALYYSDMLHLQRKAMSIAPHKGSLIHKCLEYLYSGKDWTLPIKELKVDLDKVFDEEREEWGSLPQELYRIMRGYILAYKEVDSKLKTLATEVTFEFPLDDTPHTYSGIIDWIYEDERGQVWVCDHKTAKNLPSETELYMSMQTVMYYEACRKDVGLKKLLKGKPLAGVVFNHLRTKAPREPALLKSGALSKAACDTDIATYFECVKKQGLDVKDYEDMVDKLRGNIFFRRVKFPISERSLEIIKQEVIGSLDDLDVMQFLAKTKADDPIMLTRIFPRTMLSQRCSWDCSYSKLCFAELAGLNTEGIISEDYEVVESKWEREGTEDGE